VTNRFVWANVTHRPMRTLVSMLAISLEVVMILMVVGVTRGMVVDSADRQQGLGADIYVQPSSAPAMLSSASVIMDISERDKLAAIPEIRAIAPVLMMLSTQKGLMMVYGTELDKFNEVSGGFTFFKGGPFSSPTAHEMIVDDLYAQSNGIKVGDTQQLKEQPFKICGIVRHGKGARCYVPLAALQELEAKEGKVSMLLVKCQNSTDQNSINAVAATIKQTLPGYSAIPAQEWLSLVLNNNIPALDTFINVVVTISVIIGAFAIFLSMYTTIAERTRDIGILKSLGASKIYIIDVILRESIALCLLGLVMGVLITAVGRVVIQAQFPTQQVVFSLPWVFRSALLVIVSGVLGAIYPAMQAAKKDPIKALAY
jgi:putative ABC transport system permease protein